MLQLFSKNKTLTAYFFFLQVFPEINKLILKMLSCLITNLVLFSAMQQKAENHFHSKM